ncbi:MAG: sigma-54 dependent transcriptional regulator [Prevotellaceae bacterium]|jgi:transcriptional regulator with PAS, ATPase and Fis domain|nr:sigma-54 dependent transcriptional regulator [Prevotellaceae bacterium]
MDVLQIKQRFGIIGNAPALNRALDIASQVAATDLSVLVTGESGTGKEFFPQIIHRYSNRKHGPYFAVNCGAIPEGTIDSELFGHEKGSFTSAHDTRKGYFEVADGGTLFLDEVAELPLSTQVRLLRVLETGEFLKVGSSKVQKTSVRIIAATNVNLPQAVQNGKFREDLYYRLNTVPISIPPLRERVEDISLLFRKFAADFAEKYKMPAVTLTPDARQMLEGYAFPGNIRQLKNITEQISIIEAERQITAATLRQYLPQPQNLPMLYQQKPLPQAGGKQADFSSEREILYKFLFDMKGDINELKRLVNIIMQGDASHFNSATTVSSCTPDVTITQPGQGSSMHLKQPATDEHVVEAKEVEEELLSLDLKELEMIRKALEKHRGRRKNAAQELGISERTLYRKIKEYHLD